MTYILQAKKEGVPDWYDLKLSDDPQEIENEVRDKANIIPLTSLRIVKTVEIRTTFYVEILD